jgi:hypothetical protein
MSAGAAVSRCGMRGRASVLALALTERFFDELGVRLRLD